MESPVDLARLAAIAVVQDIGLVALFGSRARGDQRPDSDLDLGGMRRDGRRMTLAELRALHHELVPLSGTPNPAVDLVDLAAADPLLRFEIISHGRCLYEAEPGLWKLFFARTLIDHDDIAPWIPRLIAGVGRAARGAGGR